MTAASLDNTGKGISISPAPAPTRRSSTCAGSAGFGTAGVLSGHVRLAGDSAIEFASGEITSLAADAQLHLNGNDAFIEDSTAPGSNSALTGLASIGAGAMFGLHNEAAVSTTGALVNDGNVRSRHRRRRRRIEPDPGGGADQQRRSHIGNATLSASDKVTAASLDNTGSIDLTGSSANQALLDVTAGSAGFGTAGVLSGYVELAGDSAIEFASGQITSLAAGAIGPQRKRRLHRGQHGAGVEQRADRARFDRRRSDLDLENGASVSTTGALVNDGTVVSTSTPATADRA